MSVRPTIQPRPDERRSPPSSVSVVVPVLDEVDDLPQQLAALAAQTYQGDWELIVCDNGSVDGTREVALSWRDRLSNLRLVDASDRRGLNHARNVGAQNAAGEFVAFCDGDDVVSATWLHGLVEAAPLGDIVGGVLDRVMLNGADARPEPKDGLPRKHDFLPAAPGGNCGIWRRVATEVGWDEEFRFGGSDIEFCWRAQLAGYELAFTPDALVNVREPVDLHTLARQWYRYGASGPQLFRTFRRHGMHRSSTRVAARTWAWLLVHSADVVGSVDVRRRWMRLAAYRTGRLVGSIQLRTLFL
jgi:glycosyltransferase involved in cell wall biosynthesis